MIFKIVEAFVLAVPIILIQLLNVVAQILVLTMILLFPVVLLMSFVPRMQELVFGVLKVMFGGLIFPAITTLLTLLIFYIEKMIENIVTNGFDGVLKTLPSLLLFGLVFKLLVSVVSKGVIYFLIWRFKGQLLQFVLGSKARMVATDIGTKVEHGVTKTKEVASQVPTRSLATAQHLGNFALAGAGFGTGLMMNAKSHFQNAGSFFTRKEPSQPETVMPAGPTEAPIAPEDPEPIIPPTQTPHDNFKPIEEESPIPPSESPIMSEGTSSSEDEFQTLREEWMSPFKQHRINTLERRLDAYKDPKAMYKAQGSNAFTRAYRQTMTRDDKIRANIERRDRLTQRLNQLRGE